MIKRVRLDKHGALTEIDWHVTDRFAKALRDYVTAADHNEWTRFDYAGKAVPLIAGVLGRTIEIPFPYLKSPYNARSQREGWELTPPEEFNERYAQLLSRITGSPAAFSLSTYEDGGYVPGKYRDVDESGNSWELCWFEG